jgi:hypothetical protein
VPFPCYDSATCHEALRDSANRLVDRITCAEDKRHKIIHGMANEDSPDDRPASEEKVHIMRDHPKHYFSERYSVPQILAIADEIADKRRYAGTVFLRVGRAREQAAGAF